MTIRWVSRLRVVPEPPCPTSHTALAAAVCRDPGVMNKRSPLELSTTGHSAARHTRSISWAISAVWPVDRAERDLDLNNLTGNRRVVEDQHSNDHKPNLQCRFTNAIADWDGEDPRARLAEAGNILGPTLERSSPRPARTGNQRTWQRGAALGSTLRIRGDLDAGFLSYTVAT